MEQPISTPQHEEMTELIDLDRYPIMDLSNNVGKTLLEHCRLSLRQTGVCNLPGFVRPQAAAAMAREGLSRLETSYRDESAHNVYFTPEEPGLDVDHPGTRSSSRV